MNRLLELEKELARFSGRGAKPNAPAPVAPVSGAQSLGNYGYSRQYTNSPEEIRILSIDGGGIRGLVPALILRELQNKITTLLRNKYQKEGFDSHSSAVVQGYFDLLAGTSTGAIIAVGLACPSRRANQGNSDFEYNVQSFVDLYKKEGTRIFPLADFKKRYGFGTIADKATTTVYDRKGLDTVLDEKLGRFSDNRFVLFNNLIKPVVVMAGDYMTGDSVIFRNWDNKIYRATDVIRASSAAPTYFAPVGFGEYDPNELPEDFTNDPTPTFQKIAQRSKKANFRYYIDGGLHQNNPAFVAFSEVVHNGANLFSPPIGHPGIKKTPFRLSNSIVDPAKVLMVSIGTGEIPTVLSVGDAKDRYAIQETPNIITQAMISSSRLAETQVRAQLNGENYFRFNPTLPEKFSEMDNANPKHLEELENLTLAYLRDPKVNAQLDILAKRLIGFQ